MHARIAVPSHTYALPLASSLRGKGFNIVEARPPEALRLLEEGRVDAAIVPLASVGKLTVCRGPMVWSHGETMSVAVYSRVHKDLDECRVIAVSGESRTSIAYLRLIAGSVGAGWKIIQARDCMSLECLLETGDCALMLGDEALRARRILEPIADLGGLVRRVLGVDPVYAVTASLSPGSCPLGLPMGEPRVDAAHVVEACRRTGLPVGMVLEYFMRVNLSFNERVLNDALTVLSRAVDIV
ncbi:MAG: hypothetical protein GSR78_04255 [Desulfurococcales archaeon]|nr:hypothetical protein [Desulfurococcales archaeon]